MNYIKNIYSSLPKKHQFIINGLIVVLVLLLILPSGESTASRNTDNEILEVGTRYDIALPNENSEPKSITHQQIPILQNTAQKVETTAIQPKALISTPALQWKTAKVKSGDSLAKILNRHGHSAKTTYLISKAKGEHTKKLLKLNVGDKIKLATNEQNELVKIEYPLSTIETLFVEKHEIGYISYKETKSIEIEEGIAHGEITSNFWLAAVKAGLNDNQIINLANVFGWDIDFALDIRKGDTFHVVYEKQFVDGKYIGTGNILSAQFINQNETFNAIRFSDGEYYNEKGASLRKAFLRAPVNFRYISSNFNPKRFHPIQKRVKAHNGTDYRAKTGTPVVAAGNGKVTHSTYNRFNGHYVFIQHGDGIVTKYLHFSKRAVKKGQRVKQGQVIGYVGSTGQSQAPHLHYEFLKNGVHRNPRTVKLPDAKPIAKQHKAAFLALAEQRITQMNNAKETLLAMQIDDE